MIVRKTEEAAAITPTESGAKGVKMKVMLGEPEGAPNFVLRHFRLEPGGCSPRHSHDWEHEVYILSGGGTVFGGGNEKSLAPGMAVFIPPNEEHQFKAQDNRPLEFICVIPRK